WKEGGISKTYQNKKYVLGWITSGRSLDNRPGAKPWKMERAYAGSNELGENIVQFQFDTQGGVLMGDLTGNNIGRPMAIILDNKLISAPNIQSQIHDKGQITGGGEGGFSRAE